MLFTIYPTVNYLRFDYFTMVYQSLTRFPHFRLSGAVSSLFIYHLLPFRETPRSAWNVSHLPRLTNHQEAV